MKELVKKIGEIFENADFGSEPMKYSKSDILKILDRMEGFVQAELAKAIKARDPGAQLTQIRIREKIRKIRLEVMGK